MWGDEVGERPAPSLSFRLGAHRTWATAQRGDAPLAGTPAHVWAWGTARLGDRVLSGADLAAAILEVARTAARSNRSADLVPLFIHLNGAWAVCVRWPDGEGVAAVDRLRTAPLFYGRLTDGSLVVADCTETLTDCVDASALDEEAAAEFLLAGYLMDGRTLRPGISQVRPGEIMHWSGREVTRTRYYRFLAARPATGDARALTTTLHSVMDEVFEDLAARYAGQRVIVPLSGGLDSRLVLAMMKRHGHSDLLAFSYGRPGSSEARTSQALAEAARVPWVLMPYEDGGWYRLISSPEMSTRYWRHAGHASSLPHLQDFMAVHGLRQGRPELDAVFMPGYVGDHIAGAWSAPFLDFAYPNRRNEGFPRLRDDGPCDRAAIREWIWRLKYGMWTSRPSERQRIERRIASFLDEAPFGDHNNSAAAFDLFEFEHRQALYIANAVRSFEHHGFRWWLPLSDSRLMEFFLSVPTPLRNARRLYALWMRDHLFLGDLRELADIPPVGEGAYVWCGPSPAGNTPGGMIRSRLAAAYRGAEPRAIRRWRHWRAARHSNPTSLRFEEWFAPSHSDASSTSLAACMHQPGSPFADCPESILDHLRERADEPLSMLNPLALLGAAYLGSLTD